MVLMGFWSWRFATAGSRAGRDQTVRLRHAANVAWLAPAWMGPS